MTGSVSVDVERFFANYCRARSLYLELEYRARWDKSAGHIDKMTRARRVYHSYARGIASCMRCRGKIWFTAAIGSTWPVSGEGGSL